MNITEDVCKISLCSSHVICVILGFVFLFPAQHRQRYLSLHTYTYAHTDRWADRQLAGECITYAMMKGVP